MVSEVAAEFACLVFIDIIVGRLIEVWTDLGCKATNAPKTSDLRTIFLTVMDSGTVRIWCDWRRMTMLV